jgi:hypothetical protein
MPLCRLDCPTLVWAKVSVQQLDDFLAPELVLSGAHRLDSRVQAIENVRK